MNEMQSADEALAAVVASRRAAAERLVTPWWYHPILGLLLASFMLTYGLGGIVVRMIGMAVFFGGIILLIKAYQRVTGLWIQGNRSGPATRWAYGLGAVGGLGMVGALGLGYSDVDRLWIWVLAGSVLVLTVVTGHLYDRSLRAHLRGK